MTIDTLGNTQAPTSLPVVEPQRCVHAISPFASCQRCVDACPRSAWTLDDQGLTLDSRACDQCGLCVPACCEAAIELDSALRPFVSPDPDDNAAYAACDRITASTQEGHVSCLHAMGLRCLSKLYSSGARHLVVARVDCTGCSRQCQSTLNDHLGELNKMLDDRGLEGLVVHELEPAEWHTKCVAAANLSRRALLQSAWRTVDRAANSKASISKFVAPGMLLDNSENTQLAPYVPKIDASLCIACGACLEMCPHKVIELVESGETQLCYQVDAASCTGCHLCVDVCDNDAIALERWVHSRPPPIPLALGHCAVCGTPYHQIKSNVSEANLCRICAASPHHRNLFQVLP